MTAERYIPDEPNYLATVPNPLTDDEIKRLAKVFKAEFIRVVPTEELGTVQSAIAMHHDVKFAEVRPLD